jgi:phosphoribosylformimino-5-aminoimidazole carboxamide ribotide isomerase
MDLYARVNVLDGRAVRLPRGDVNDAIALHNDPLGRVNNWFDQGADYVHVVDLDAAAFGDPKNRELIDSIIDRARGPVQIAGGIRSHVEAARLLDRGAWRIVMGTAAIEDQNMVWDLCRDFPGQVAVSVDVRPDEEVATRGWTQNSGRYLEEVLIEMSSAGAAAFFVMAAGRDVLAEPANLKILSEALATVEEPVVAAGGARDIEDLRKLVGLSIHGRRLSGLIVGREVTQGRFTLKEARRLIAAGTEESSSDEVASRPIPRGRTTPPLLADASSAFTKAADLAEEAALAARNAARLIQTGEDGAATSHALAAKEALESAREQLEAVARPDSVPVADNR